MRWLIALTVALLGVRALSAVIVSQPGYTDAYYYAVVAERIAGGQGLTADFIWNFLEAPQFAVLPIASHRFWMPLASVVPAIGMVTMGGPLGDFRAGQLVLIAVAAFIPVVTFLAARRLGADVGWALAAAAVAGLGGAFAPGWVSIDSFGLAAVIGTGFFLAYWRAWEGSARAGLVAGLLVGLLHLCRAEGALFGLALLPLLARERTRRAGAAGTAVALAIGLGWVVRGLLLTYPNDLWARAMFLVTYQEFFAVEAPTLQGFLDASVFVLLSKFGALVNNLMTAVMTLLIVLLVPIVAAVRARRDDPAVRAFVALAVLIFLVQSVVFTQHSTRGSFFHSLSALFPFAVALAAVGAQDLFGSANRGLARVAAVATVVAFTAMSATAVLAWDAEFNTLYRQRAAVASTLPPGTIVTTDAAAWRWISGQRAVVAASDGERAAFCAAEIYLAETLILEEAHFTTYDQLYRVGGSDLFTLREEHNGIKLYDPDDDQRCIVPTQL